MKLAFYGVLAMVLMMGLTACGGGNAPANTQTESTETTANNTSANSEPAGPEFLNYSVTLGGAASGKFEGAMQVINPVDGQRLISLIGPDNITQAIIQMPASVAAGQYTLNSGDYRAQIATSYDDAGMFTKEVSGTLNITSGNPLQGTFDFSAKNAAGDSATASGSFDEAAFSYNVNVSGGFEATAGSVNAIVFQDEFALTFDSPEGESGMSFSLYLPNTISAGEYGLATTYPKPAEGQVGIIINTHEAGETTAYDANITGTLTLTEVDGKFTGSFKGSADSAAGKTINFEGTFENIPLVTAHDAQ